MEILIRFTFYSTLCCCFLWTSSCVKGERERMLLKEPDNGWKNWNSYQNWQISKVNLYSICAVGGTRQEWLVTPFISLAEPVTDVQVKMKYNLKSCKKVSPSTPCSTKVTLLKIEQDTGIQVPKPSTNSFTEVKAVETLDEASLTETPADTQPKITSVFTVNVQERGVFLAIRVQSACIVLFSFEVFYTICASEGIHLVAFPETVSPSAGSPKVNVTGTCVRHALSSQSSTLYAFCDSSGNWSAGANVSCVCKAGYQRNVLLNTCEVCPKGTFKEKNGLESCIGCPLHSSQDTPAVRCNCDMGYYRTPKEDDTSNNCTSIPSAPVDARASFTNASATRLEWREPADTGGRTDLFYEIKCYTGKSECGSNVRYYPGSTGLTQTSVFISDLKPYTSYRFQVFSKNGVSVLAGTANHTQIYMTTTESIPGKPSEVKVSRGEDLTTAHIKWTLEAKNGKVLFYEVSYYNLNSGSVGKINSTYTNITIYGLDPDSEYRFQVRAYTSAGFGQSSKDIVSKKKSSPNGSLALYVGIGCAVVVVLLVILIAVLCLRRRSNGSGVESGTEMVPTKADGQRLYIDPSDYGSMLAALHNFASEIDKSFVKLQDIIGGGEFGEVHKGTLARPEEKPETVAVKILRNDVSLKSRDDFLSEAAIMGQFSHPNVIQMKGVVTKSMPMMIITEYMENGSLEDFLKANVRQLTSLQLIGMARGVASGMAYLADMNFIHRDLAARNILVSENKSCKVADFGLSRELESDNPDSEYMTQGGKIAVRWTALEAIKYRKFSSASDVWSYGILFWEIMTFGERPYWDWSNFEVMDQIERGYRLPSPANCPKVIHNLMVECWVVDKTRRPKFADIVRRLDELIRSPDLLRDDLVYRNNTVDYESIKTVEELLKSINMGKYTSNFAEAGYANLGELVDLGDKDLDRVGVKLAGHRNKIKKSVKGLRDFLLHNSEAEA